MIKTILTHIDSPTAQIEFLNQEVACRLSTNQEDIERLDSIPGIATRMAEQILAENGTDVKKQFPSAANLYSWAGIVPGHNKSAGERKCSTMKKGNKYLKSALIEAAHSVRGSKIYLGALYRRTASRKGKKRAGISVAHATLRIAYYLLTRKEMYVDWAKTTLINKKNNLLFDILFEDLKVWVTMWPSLNLVLPNTI